MCLSSLLKKLLLLPFLFSLNIYATSPFSLDDFLDHYKELTSFYKEKLRRNPQDINLRLKLAEFYYKLHNYKETVSLLKNISSLEAKILLAKAYTKFKEYDFALQTFEEIDKLIKNKKISIEDSEYFYLYGNALEKKNIFNKAIKQYLKVNGPLEKEAESRIKAIKLNTVKEIPAYIKKISVSSRDFLKKMSQEAVFVHLVDESFQMTPHNTSISTIHVIQQILKERGKKVAEVEIGYDSTYEKVELIFAHTITKEGEVVSVGKENIRDVSKYLDYPLYSNARAFIISMPSVDIGSIIEYKVKIYSSKLINEDDFSIVYRLREQYPIFNAKFKLILPHNKKIYFKYLHKERAEKYSLEPQTIYEKKNKIYLWEFKCIEPIVHEYNMPPLAEVNPAIIISSFSSWEEIYKWWHKLFIDKIILNKEVKAFVDNLIKEVSSDLEKAKRIYEFCTKNIRYVAVEYGKSGYEPHLANEVFLNRYGDCKDQTVLLTAMLRYAGLKAYPVLIPTREVYPISKDFPSINFNHAICALDYKGKLIFMDPTSETTSFGNLPLGDQNRYAMVFKDKGEEIIRTPLKKNNAIIYKTIISLDKEGKAVIEREVTTKGFYTTGYRWYLKHTHPDKIKEDIQNKMIEISSFARLLEYKIKNIDSFDEPPLLYYRFLSKQFLNPAGNLRIVSLPTDIGVDYNLISKEKRNFSVDFDGVYTKNSTVKIVLPPNLKVKYLPQNINLHTKHFSFSVTYKVKNNTIIVQRIFTVKKRFVSEDEYQVFKKKLELVCFFLREKIILIKI